MTGLLVLYNNMLQSLFESQILTLAIVVLALLGMFWILFRSLKVALIALVPNLLAVGAVLGFMGWLNIPLDMMTITIAAISMGIAVDNTIHYIYRFKREFKVSAVTSTRCIFVMQASAAPCITRRLPSSSVFPSSFCPISFPASISVC